LWRETDFEVKRVKSWRFRNTFFKIQMSKTWTPLWRETPFEVKRVKTWAVSEHVLKLGCRISARRCGAKRASNSKCKKRTTFKQLLNVGWTRSWCQTCPLCRGGSGQQPKKLYFSMFGF
jgi:hypothetical protein